MATTRRQEQEPATGEISEVAPGVLRLQLPIALPGLGHVNCYVLEDERGVAVVDPGLPGPRPWKALVERLGQAGVPVRRVHTVVVTHSHPDHFGGAGRLRKESGADVVTHRRFRTWWDPTEPEEDPETAPTGATRDPKRPPWDQPTPWGGKGYQPDLRRRLSYRALRAMHRWYGTPAPTTRIDDAQTVRLARREWIAVHTPGHTPDHLCLLDPAEGVLLSGDHVLPTITPHISGLSPAADPLAEFFASLDKVGALQGVTRVLPAHGHPFDDLHGRVDAIKRHHEERLEKLEVTGRALGRPGSVHEYAQHLFSARAQGPMADSETYAHLEHLRLAGLAEREQRGDELVYAVG